MLPNRNEIALGPHKPPWIRLSQLIGRSVGPRTIVNSELFDWMAQKPQRHMHNCCLLGCVNTSIYANINKGRAERLQANTFGKCSRLEPSSDDVRHVWFRENQGATKTKTNTKRKSSGHLLPAWPNTWGPPLIDRREPMVAIAFAFPKHTRRIYPLRGFVF